MIGNTFNAFKFVKFNIIYLEDISIWKNQNPIPWKIDLHNENILTPHK